MEKTITMPLSEYEELQTQMSILRENAKPDTVYIVVDQFGNMGMSEYGESSMVRNLIRERNYYQDLCSKMVADVAKNVPDKYINKMTTMHY